MSKIYFHSEYTKNIKHIMNYLVYAGEKLEAQEILLNNGDKVSISPDKFVDFDKYEDVQGVRVNTKNGRELFFTPDEYIRLINQDKNAEYLSPKGYIDYIGERPGVVKDEIGGLFTINGSISTDEALSIAEEYPDNTWWVNILSLKRSDGERVGFDNRESFENLVRSKIPDICKHYNISLENLILYGAYHDKINNPHVHLFFTSKDNREGFVKDLNKSSLNMKSSYFNTIYKDDMQILYKEKDTHKIELHSSVEQCIKTISSKQYLAHKDILNSYIDLSNALKTEKGKLQYGYLSKTTKRLVDNLITNIVCKDKEVSKCFQKCLDTQEKFLRNYTDNEEIIMDKLDDYKIKLLMPYSKQKDNVLQNIVIKNVATYNYKNLNISTNDDMSFAEYAFNLEYNPKFMYKVGKDYLYKKNNSLEALELLSKSYMMLKDRYTAFELGNTYMQLDDIQNARNYFNDYKILTNESNIKFNYEFFTLSKYYEYYKTDFKDLSQYNSKEILSYMTDDFINKKESEYSLKEYLALKVSAELGYPLAVQKIKDIPPISLTDNMSLDYSIHSDNPYLMNELKQIILLSNLQNKESHIYDLSLKIINKITYNETTDKYKTKFSLNEKILLAKSCLDLSNVSKDTYLSKNIFAGSQDYVAYFEEYYDKFLDLVQNIMDTKGYEYKKIDFAVYILKQNNQNTEIANYIINKLLDDKVKLNEIINVVKDDTEIKRNILIPLVEKENIQAMYLLGKDYLFSDLSTDKQKGIELLENAVDKGHLYATLTLGNYYLSSKNDDLVKRGIELLTPLSEKGNAQAMYYLGKYYFYQDDKNIKQKGLNLITKASEKNHIYAKLFLINEHMKYEQLTKQELLFLKKLSSKSNENKERNAQATFLLAKYFIKNNRQLMAIPLLNYSANNGNDFALILLSEIYLKQDDEIMKEKGISNLNKLISNENENAMYSLGKYYLGSGNENEIERGIELLKNAVDKGHLYATLTLGNYYLSSKDDDLVKRGVELLTPLSEKGNAQAMYYLGKYYFYQDDKNIKQKGLNLITKASEKNHIYAKLFLINEHMKHEQLTKQELLFLKKLSSKSNENKERNAQATFLLAKHFIKNNRELMAIPLLNYSANNGNDFALILLSEIYLKQDDEIMKEKGISNLNKLISNGNENAMYSLGKYYLGSGNENEIQKGVDILENAVDKGHDYSKLLLISYYLKNENPKANEYICDLKQSDDEYLQISAYRISSKIELNKENLKVAEKELLFVVNSNYVTGTDIYNLANIYDKMDNDTLANTYYTQALNKFKEENTPISNYMLGIMYLTGRGCEKDKKIAKEYFKIADEAGHPNAKEMITSINKQTIYACNQLLTSVAYHFLNIANDNYEYNKQINSAHHSKKSRHKTRYISKTSEQTRQNTKSQSNWYNNALEY